MMQKFIRLEDDGLVETVNHDIAPESYLPRSTWNKGAMSGRFQWLQDTTTFEVSYTLEIAVKTTEIKN